MEERRMKGHDNCENSHSVALVTGGMGRGGKHRREVSTPRSIYNHGREGRHSGAYSGGSEEKSARGGVPVSQEGRSFVAVTRTEAAFAAKRFCQRQLAAPTGQRARKPKLRHGRTCRRQKMRQQCRN